MQGASKRMLDAIVEAARSQSTPDTPKEATDAYVDVLRAMWDAIHRSECHVTGRDSQPPADPASSIRAVHYACKVVDLGSVMASVPEPQQSKNPAAANKAAIAYSKEVAAKVAAAAPTKQIEDNLMLVHIAETDMWIADPKPLLEKIHSSMLDEKHSDD